MNERHLHIKNKVFNIMEKLAEPTKCKVAEFTIVVGVYINSAV